jgi:hypothetical protein
VAFGATLSLTNLQLDSKDDIVGIDAHVELSRTGHWLFVLKRDAIAHVGGERKQVCFILFRVPAKHI